ncbi:deoxyadenosine kinase [Limosilactobacillus coleohominis DSM 14060]|nr:deoxyadenosine kinase [Limosilactobacillus coleohominis DSM 14060]
MVYSETDFETILYRIKKRGRDYEQIDNKPELKDYYYKMWNAYKKWYRDYDASPKMKIDLEKYNLEDPRNVDIVLQMIDDKLASLR